MKVICSDGEIRRVEEQEDHLNDDLDSDYEDLNKKLHPEEYPF